MHTRLLSLLLCLLLTVSQLSFAAAEAELPPLTEAQKIAYFSRSLFIGDSITRQLHSFVNKKRTEEGYPMKTTFITATSYSLYTASRRTVSENRIELQYHGRSTPMFRIVERIQPRTVFILLGVNDYAGTQIEKSIGHAEKIIDNVAEVSPDTRVVFISLTPVTRKFCAKKDYRTMWDEYNAALSSLCERRGVGFLNIADDLKDEEGYLRKGFSSDGQYHLGSAALQIWLDDLLAFAESEYQAGRWTPTEE